MYVLARSELPVCNRFRSAASKVYGKTLEINEQYDVLPKAKSALDVVSTAAGNLDSNYGITKKIDEQLKLSQSVCFIPAVSHHTQTAQSLHTCRCR